MLDLIFLLLLRLSLVLNERHSQDLDQDWEVA